MPLQESAQILRSIGTLRENDGNAITGDMDAFFPMPGTHATWPLAKIAFVNQIRQAPAVTNYAPPQAAPKLSKLLKNQIRQSVTITPHNGYVRTASRKFKRDNA